MRFIVIGCGRIGTGLAQNLLQRGHDVTVIDSDPSAFEALGPLFRGTTVAGIGIDRDVLLRAGIERSDGLAAVTSSDETNVVAAQIARQIFRVPHVAARVNQPRQAAVYHRLGLQTISPTTWAINRIADVLCHSRLSVVGSLGTGEVDLLQVEIPSTLAGKLVRDLTITSEVTLVAITRGHKTFLPTQGTVLEAGDQVHVAMVSSAADQLNRMLGL